MADSRIVLAGATGSLGGHIARALRKRGASVRALVRRDTAQDKLERLQALGAEIACVDMSSEPQVTEVCSGVPRGVGTSGVAGRDCGTANGS